MGHAITALIVHGPADQAAAREWDVAAAPIGHRLRLIHISPAYAAYQHHRHGSTGSLCVPAGFPPVFPREGVLAELAAAVTGTRPATFAVDRVVPGGLRRCAGARSRRSRRPPPGPG